MAISKHINNFVTSTGGGSSPWYTSAAGAAIGAPLGAAALYGAGKLLGWDTDTGLNKRRLITGTLLGGALGGIGGYYAALPQYKALNAGLLKQSQLDGFYMRPAVESIILDPTLSNMQRNEAIQFLNNADTNYPKGLITKQELVRAAVGSGLGYLAGQAVGGTLELLLGMPAQQRRRLAQIGAIGGLLTNTGIIQ